MLNHSLTKCLIEVTYGLANTLLATSNSNILSIPRSSMIDGGETYTVKFLFTKSDSSLDSVLATFDVVDNWNVDFYLEDGSISSRFILSLFFV